MEVRLHLQISQLATSPLAPMFTYLSQSHPSTPAELFLYIVGCQLPVAAVPENPSQCLQIQHSHTKHDI
jgi:hypothetical protein